MNAFWGALQPHLWLKKMLPRKISKSKMEKEENIFKGGVIMEDANKLYETMKEFSTEEIQNCTAKILSKTKEYPEYIEFISKLCKDWTNSIQKDLARAKMVSSAIFVRDDCVNINKDNWFVFARIICNLDDSNNLDPALESLLLVDTKLVASKILDLVYKENLINQFGQELIDQLEKMVK